MCYRIIVLLVAVQLVAGKPSSGILWPQTLPEPSTLSGPGPALPCLSAQPISDDCGSSINGLEGYGNPGVISIGSLQGYCDGPLNLPEQAQAAPVEIQNDNYRLDLGGEQNCVTHQLVSNVRPVVDECIRQVPVIRKTIRNQEEQITRHVPVVEKTVTEQEEKIIRHVPVVQKYTRPVIEMRTRHVPVIKQRVTTVVEPYTTHVPVTEKFSRPVEEAIIRKVPIVERRTKPVVHQRIRHVPVTERRTRPIVESHIINVPVRQRVVKNLVEQRIQQVQVPCQPCPPGSSSLSAGLNTISDLSSQAPQPQELSSYPCLQSYGSYSPSIVQSSEPASISIPESYSINDQSCPSNPC